MGPDTEELLDIVRRTLAEAGLPEDPRQVEGQTFVFGDEQGKHYVFGSITSVGYGPNEGVLLYVSAPRFRGMDIYRLGRNHDDAWIAYGQGEGPPYLLGKFVLLPQLWEKR